MPDCEKYVARHGEIGALEIVERLERYEGVRRDGVASLEDRWANLRHNDPARKLAAAA